MSLRGRLALWYVLAMSVVIFGLVFTAQRTMVASLRTGLDERLQLRAEMVINTINSARFKTTTDYAEVFQELVEYQFPSLPLFVRISNPRIEILAKYGDIPQQIVQTLDSKLSMAGIVEGRFDDVDVSGAEALRVYTIAARDPSTLKTFAVIQIGESLVHIVAAENQLWLYAIIEGVVGSLITLFIVMVILTQGFRPLDRILNRVQEIRDTNLSIGIPTEPRPPELQRLTDSLNSMWRRLDVTLRAIVSGK